MSTLLIHAAGRGRFHKTAVVGHRVVEPEAAGKIISLIAVARQNAAGDIAAQAALAHYVDWLTPLHLIQPLPQLVHGNIAEAGDMAGGVLRRRAGIQQGDAAVPGQSRLIRQMPLLHNAVF